MRGLVAVLVLSASAMAANDVYIAATAVGGDTGVDCANAKALTYFNNVANWSATPTGIQIGPNTTAHLCGTFTASAGADSYIQFQGSGTAGNPITLKWETGAIVQAPYFNPAHGGVDLNAKINLTIDGGTNGILRNTDNGTGLGNQQASALVKGDVCTNCIFTNLTAGPVYVHTSLADASGGSTYAFNVQGGSSVTFGPSLTVFDADVGILYGFAANYSDLLIHDNMLYDSNQNAQVGNIGAFTLNNFSFFANTCHDWSKWDDNTNAFHHNCLHEFTVGAAARIQGVHLVYNNYIYGDLGDHATSMIFSENNTGGLTNGSPQIFNNILSHTASNNSSANGLIYVQSVGGIIANNTFIDAGGTAGDAWNCVDIAANSWYVKNNIYQGCATYIYMEPTHTFNVSQRNEYYLGGPQWVYQATFAANLGAWQAACSCDSLANVSNPNLNGSFQPIGPSGAIGAGENLTGLSITALNSDKNGNARPGAGAWTIGALNTAGGVSFIQRRR